MPSFAANRKVFFLAVNTGYAIGRQPDGRCRDFYGSRSGNGLYCAIVGNVVVPGGFGNNDVCAEISPSESWRDLAGRIAERGTRPGIQLTSAWRDYRGMRSFVSRGARQAILDYKAAVGQMSENCVRDMIARLRRGTEYALDAGFRHIQVHAAHGYLFSLLIDEQFCAHSELMLDGLKGLAVDLSRADIETSLRFSLITGDQAFDEGRRTSLADRLFALPFSFFDISFGFYNIDKHLIYPSGEEALTARRVATVALARRFADRSVILSGRYKESSDNSLPANIHIGICRDLIANPDFLRDSAKGCINCMKCHYFSRRTRDLACGQWMGGSGSDGQSHRPERLRYETLRHDQSG